METEVPNRAYSPSLNADIGTVALVAAFLIVFLKVLGVAGFSVTTAMALVTAAPASVVLGTLTFYAYPVMPLLAVVFILWFLNLRRSSHLPGATTWMSIAGGLAVLAIALSPASYLRWAVFLIVGFVVVYTAIRRIIKRSNWLSGFWGGFSTSFRWYFVFLIVAGFLSTVQSMWLPAEVLTFEADAPTIGHIIEEENGNVTFLRWSDRALVRVPSPLTDHVVGIKSVSNKRVPTSKLTGRQVCHWETPGPSAKGPVYYFFFGKEYESPNLRCSRIICEIGFEHPDVPRNSEVAIVRDVRRLTNDERCPNY